MIFRSSVPGIETRNVSDISPLAIGSYVIMQRSQGRYIDQVVCMYKKDGGGEGTRHESVLFAGTKDVPSLTNLGLRVFIQASGAFFLLACIDFNSQLLRRTLKKVKTHFGTTASPQDTCQYQGTRLQSRNIRALRPRRPISRSETVGF